MKNILITTLALAGALLTTSSAQAGQCYPNPVDGGVLDCDGKGGEYYCYGNLTGSWTCRAWANDDEFVWETDCPACEGVQCDAWLEVFGPGIEFGACADSSLSALASVIKDASLYPDDISWCESDREGSICHDECDWCF